MDGGDEKSYLQDFFLCVNTQKLIQKSNHSGIKVPTEVSKWFGFIIFVMFWVKEASWPLDKYFISNKNE